MDNVTRLQQQAALKALQGQLPGSMSGGDVFSGLSQILMGFMSGTAGVGPSTMSSAQYANEQRRQQFENSVISNANTVDRRIPNMLAEAGTVATGSRAGGDEWARGFEGLPDGIKNAILSAFNSSALGQLVGGDPKALATASINMLSGNNQFTSPGQFDLGGRFSSERAALAGDIHKSLISDFVDPVTGLPNMQSTQGQSFDNLGKFTQAMTESGGLRSRDLIQNINKDTGAVELNTSALEGAQKNIKKGMELFRNLTDVFGSRDFNELMSQAERLGGLDMSDPTSIGRTLTAVRNARGVARSVGLDERRVLGDLALANDTMVQMGVDRRTAASFNNQTLAGAVTQGQSNVQNISPFDTGFRRRLGPSEMIQQAAMSNAQMLAEGEANPHGGLALGQAIRTYFSKPGREDQYSQEVRDARDAAFAEKDPILREQKLRNLASMIKSESGVSIPNMIRELGLSNIRDTASRETLDQMAEDNSDVLLSRNKRRFRHNYLKHEFNTGRMRSELSGKTAEEEEALEGDEDVIALTAEREDIRKRMSELSAKAEGMADGKEKNDILSQVEANQIRLDTINSDAKVSRLDKLKSIRAGIGEFEDLLTNSPDSVGLDGMAHLLGIAEGKDGEITYYDRDTKSYVTKNANQMTPEEKRKAIAHNLMANGVDAGEVEELTDSIMKAPETLTAVANETGMKLNSASSGAANLYEQLGGEMSQFRISKSARDRAEAATIAGASELEGGPAMTDPLQNAIFGFMGRNEKEARDLAFTELGAQGGFVTDSLSINALSTTATQKELASDLADTKDPDKRREISEREGTRKALTDLSERIIPKLQEITLTDADGKEIGLAEAILADGGLENPKEQLAKFRSDLAEASALELDAANLEKEGKTEEADAKRQEAQKLREGTLRVAEAILGQVGGDGQGNAPMGVLETLRKRGAVTNLREDGESHVLDIAAGGADALEERTEFNKDLGVRQAKRLKALKENLGIDDLDITGIEKSLEEGDKSKISSKELEDIKKGMFTRDAMGVKGDSEKDLISRLATGDSEEIISEFKNFGMSPKEIRSGLQEAQKEVEKQLAGTDLRDKDREAAERRLSEIKEAQKNVTAKFTKDDTPGLLVELIDKLNTLIGGSTVLKVQMQ